MNLDKPKTERRVLSGNHYGRWTRSVNDMLEDGWELKDFKLATALNGITGTDLVVVGYLERIKTPKRNEE